MPEDPKRSTSSASNFLTFLLTLVEQVEVLLEEAVHLEVLLLIPQVQLGQLLMVDSSTLLFELTERLQWQLSADQTLITIMVTGKTDGWVSIGLGNGAIGSGSGMRPI